MKKVTCERSRRLPFEISVGSACERGRVSQPREFRPYQVPVVRALVPPHPSPLYCPLKTRAETVGDSPLDPVAHALIRDAYAPRNR